MTELRPEDVSLGNAGFRDEVLPFFHERGFHKLGDFTGFTGAELTAKGIVKRRLGFVREKLEEKGLYLKSEGAKVPKPKKVRPPAPVVQSETGDKPEVEETEPAEEPEEEIKFGSVMPDGTTDLEAFTRKNERLTYSFVLRTRYKHLVLSGTVDAALDIEDLFQEAFLGFLTAVGKFDRERGIKFSTYAWHCMRQRVGRALQNSGTIRIPVHLWEHIGQYVKAELSIRRQTGRWPHPEEMQRALDISDATFEGLKSAMMYYRSRIMAVYSTVGGGETKEEKRERILNEKNTSSQGHVNMHTIPEDVEASLYARLTLQSVLANVTLLEVEQEILIRRFGLDGDTPQTLQDVGDALGLTRERIRQREADALEKLRDPRLWEVRTENVENLNDKDIEGTKEGRLDRVGKRKILQVVCEYYHRSKEEMLGHHGRGTSLTAQRRILMYLLRECAQISYVEIGEFLERNHGTAMQGYKVVHKGIETDPMIRIEVRELLELLYPNKQKKTEPEEAEEIKAEVIPQEPASPIGEGQYTKPQTVVEAVCEYYGADKADILGGSSDPLIVLPRKVLIYLLSRYTQESRMEIGLFVGRRSHTVVAETYTWVKDAMKTDEELAQDITELRLILGEKHPQQPSRR